jgi:LysM repeat protein
MDISRQMRWIVGLFIILLTTALVGCLWANSTNSTTIQRLRTENSVLSEESARLSAALEETTVVIPEVVEIIEEEVGPINKTHHVLRNNTLWDLSESYYGDPLYFSTIANANDIEGPDYIIYEGTDIIIPAEKGERFVGTLIVHNEEVLIPAVETLTEEIPLVVETVTEEVITSELVEEPASVPVNLVVETVVEEVSAPVVLIAPVAPVIENSNITETSHSVAEFTATADVKYPTTLPGNTWFVFGNLSPIEEGNRLAYAHFEQGITLWRNGQNSIVPYISVDTSGDSEGYDWNNKAVLTAGVKYIRGIPRGVIQIGGGWSHEERYRSSFNASQVVGFGSYWLGWHPVTSDGCNTCLLFPGNSWGLTGNISPSEGNNVLSSLYVQQGIRALKLGRASVIPYGEVTLGVDTDKYFWNNRRILGGGLELAIPFGSSVFNIGAVYRDEYRWKNNQRGNGWTAYVDIWSGWNPSAISPKGGQ